MSKVVKCTGLPHNGVVFFDLDDILGMDRDDEHGITELRLKGGVSATVKETVDEILASAKEIVDDGETFVDKLRKNPETLAMFKEKTKGAEHIFADTIKMAEMSEEEYEEFKDSDEYKAYAERHGS